MNKTKLLNLSLCFIPTLLLISVLFFNITNNETIKSLGDKSQTSEIITSIKNPTTDNNSSNNEYVDNIQTPEVPIIDKQPNETLSFNVKLNSIENIKFNGDLYISVDIYFMVDNELSTSSKIIKIVGNNFNSIQYKGIKVGTATMIIYSPENLNYFVVNINVK